MSFQEEFHREIPKHIASLTYDRLHILIHIDSVISQILHSIVINKKTLRIEILIIVAYSVTNNNIY